MKPVHNIRGRKGSTGSGASETGAAAGDWGQVTVLVQNWETWSEPNVSVLTTLTLVSTVGTPSSSYFRKAEGMWCKNT